MDLANLFSAIDDVLCNGSGGLLENGACLTLEYDGCRDFLYEAVIWGVVGDSYVRHAGKGGETLGESLLRMDSSLLTRGALFDCDLGLKNLEEKMRVGVGLGESSYGVIAVKGCFGGVLTSLVYGGSSYIFNKRVVVSVDKKTLGEGVDALDSINISDSFVGDAVLGEGVRLSGFEYPRKN